jgi:D-alanine-D-alanine ligase-like ATP-grasp enzyme
MMSSDSIALSLDAAYSRLVSDLAPNRWSARSVSGHAALILNAARRAGLQVEKNGKKTIFRRGNAVVGGLNSMYPHTTSWLGYRLCKSKEETREIYHANVVPQPIGQIFGVDEKSEARAFIEHLGGRVVLKPADGAGGHGVMVGVTSSGFNDAWAACADACRKYGDGARLLVEEYVSGVDVRCLVIAGSFFCASARFPANVVGNGRDGIEALLQEKNAVRKQNPHLRYKPIPVDDDALHRMKAQGWRLEDVPAAGERAWLSSTSNVSIGGDSIDVTDLISGSTRRLAERAVDVVPGIDTAGVDIIVDVAGPTNESGTVIEVNASPNFGIHHYPLFGKAWPAAEELVARLFMEQDSSVSYST